MARTLKIHFSDPACCVLGDGDLLSAVIAGTATPEHITQVRRCRGQLHQLRSTPPIGIFLINADANRTVSAQVREAVQQLANDGKSGSAVVLYGGGLAASLIRSILTAISVLAHIQTRVLSDLPTAMAWLAPQLEPPLAPSDIAAVSQQLLHEYESRGGKLK